MVLTAYFVVLSLGVVQTAPRMVSSTPRGGEEVRSSILCTFMLIFRVGLLREELSLYILLVSLQFLAKEDQGFAVIFRIHVDSGVDGVFLYVIVSFVM